MFFMIRTGTSLESLAIAGDSPLQVSIMFDCSILSSAGHVESCVNLPGPSGKAKYSLETDSEQVP